MSTPAILDADMATLARWARSGFDWWREELQALMPANVQRWLNPGPAIVARYGGQGFALTKRGEAIPRRSGRATVAIALPHEAVLIRDCRLPALGQADLRRLVAFDAERLLPFPAGTALVAFETGARGSDGQQAVRVAGLPMVDANAVMAAAAADGLDVARLGIDDPDGVQFDFLSAWRAAAGVKTRAPQQFWWAVVAIGFVLNLGVLIGRDVYNLRETEALVEAHGQTAQTARLLRARVLTEDARRRTLVDRRSQHDPLRVLAAATAALPDAASVQKLAWDGAQLRLTGYTAAGVDVVAMLRRSMVFSAVRNSAADVPAQSTIRQPFDVTADAAAPL